MMMPTRENWARRAPERLDFYGQYLHPNPRFYKYKWQVWTPDRELEGGAFFQSGPRLSTAQFMALQGEMRKAGKPGWV
jgi:hypothetical protein